jgi:flavin-binding protein dodecin
MNIFFYHEQSRRKKGFPALILDKYGLLYIVKVIPLKRDTQKSMRGNREKEVKGMADTRVARVSEVIAGSPKSFDDAIQQGFKRASKTLRGITGMRVLEHRVSVENEKIVEYRVRMEVIFVLED